MSSNLPPGVTVGMLPGNRPEDIAFDKFCDWALDQYADSCLDVSECRRAVLIGIAAVKAEEAIIRAVIVDARHEERIFAMDEMAAKDADEKYSTEDLE